jgi:type IV pilus assembly protein PilB
VSIILKRKKSTENLNTITPNKKFRVQRLKEDLDRSFQEMTAREDAVKYGLQYINLYGFPVDSSHLNIISKDDVINLRVGVFAAVNRDLKLATDNFNSAISSGIIQNLKNLGYNVVLFYCSTDSIDKIIKSYDQINTTALGSDDVNISSEKIDSLKSQVKGLNEIQKIVSNVSVSEIIEIILISSIENQASDIHFEPEKDDYHLRLRLDGVLYTFAKMPKIQQKNIESRIKLLSGLKLNVDNVPQDGRFTFKIDNKEIDVRVSMLPSTYGYSIVLRLLGTENVKLNFDDLGFDGVSLERVLNAVKKPQGLILTTGPTGSGKTTTLYTLLSVLNNGSNKIITLEDPIEYKIQGISQTQIDTKSGYTFGNGLRSILRQDPDILLVGEIRDAETAEIAVQSSLTGHKVLSTVHTNDAAGAIPRLLELGIPPYILVDALEIIVGQRLVRKICQFCKEPDNLSEETRELIIKEVSELPADTRKALPENLSFFTSKGCDKCNNLGYKGRIGLYEVLKMSDPMRDLLSTSLPNTVAVRKTAKAEGMVTMFQDGILKASKGITDMKEVLRNVQY